MVYWKENNETITNKARRTFILGGTHGGSDWERAQGDLTKYILAMFIFDLSCEYMGVCFAINHSAAFYVLFYACYK